MDIGIIAMIVLAIMGAVMFFAPRMLTQADKRDDPESVAQVKKLGAILFAAAVIAGLLMLKYASR